MDSLKDQLHRITITVRKGYNPFDYVERISWDGINNDLMLKYKWYFDYRHALLKVKYPRKIVDMHHYAYQPETTTELERHETRIKNLILAKRRKITEINNRLRQAEYNWCQLFPITEDVFYKKAVEKLDRLKCELKELGYK